MVNTDAILYAQRSGFEFWRVFFFLSAYFIFVLLIFRLDFLFVLFLCITLLHFSFVFAFQSFIFVLLNNSYLFG